MPGQHAYGSRRDPAGRPRRLAAGSDEGQPPPVQAPDQAWHGDHLDDVKAGTWNSILKQAGLKERGGP